MYLDRESESASLVINPSQYTVRRQPLFIAFFPLAGWPAVFSFNFLTHHSIYRFVLLFNRRKLLSSKWKCCIALLSKINAWIYIQKHTHISLSTSLALALALVRCHIRTKMDSIAAKIQIINIKYLKLWADSRNALIANSILEIMISSWLYNLQKIPYGTETFTRSTPSRASIKYRGYLNKNQFSTDLNRNMCNKTHTTLLS